MGWFGLGIIKKIQNINPTKPIQNLIGLSNEFRQI